MMKRIALCILIVFSFVTLAHACPMCKDSIPNSDAQQAGSLPSGFNNSVYMMLVGFMTVLGMVITMIVRAIRGTRPAQAGFEVIDPHTRG